MAFEVYILEIVYSFVSEGFEELLRLRVEGTFFERIVYGISLLVELSAFYHQ